MGSCASCSRRGGVVCRTLKQKILLQLHIESAAAGQRTLFYLQLCTEQKEPVSTELTVSRVTVKRRSEAELD